MVDSGNPERDRPEIDCAEPVPTGLLEAFWRYDAALLANDKAVLDQLFLPGPATLRGDGRNLLVGHDAISGFRSARSAIPTRAVAALHVRVLSDRFALIMARTADGAATGLQTQLWQLTGDGWRVTAAHVSLPSVPPNPVRADSGPADSGPADSGPADSGPADSGPAVPAPPASGRPAFDRSVWRVVGAPLAAPLGRGPLGRGPLDGYDVAVKDLYAVAGQPVGGGVPGYLIGQPPQADSAWAVRALRRAGAELTGIAQTDEFAYSIAGRNAHYGAPPNPAAPDRLGGGSSSGPAAAVALGQARIGLGTDTAGSIRIPASYQGLVGFRPTHGAVSTEGVLPLAPSFDTVGWLTRDVIDSQAVARVLLSRPPDGAVPDDAVPDDAVPDGAAQDCFTRVIRLPDVEALADPGVRAQLGRFVEQAQAAGLLPPTAEISLAPETVDTWFAAFRTVQAYEAWQAHGPWITAHPGALGADVAGRFAAAATVTAEQAADGRATAARARAELTSWLDGAVLMLPTAPGPAPLRTAGPAEIDDVRGRTLRISCLAPLAGAPAVSLPLPGRTDPSSVARDPAAPDRAAPDRAAPDRAVQGRGAPEDRAPVGLCLIGAPGTDTALLSLAARLDTARLDTARLDTARLDTAPLDAKHMKP